MNIRHVFAIDSHAGGEAARIVVGPLMWRRFDTITQKKEYFEQNYAGLRKALIFEPKGHDNMFGAIISEPCDPRADIGIFFIESNECLNMCGHGTIATVTALIELGVIETDGKNEKAVVLDTPAGLVSATAKIEGEKGALRELPQRPVVRLQTRLPRRSPGIRRSCIRRILREATSLPRYQSRASG